MFASYVMIGFRRQVQIQFLWLHLNSFVILPIDKKWAIKRLLSSINLVWDNDFSAVNITLSKAAICKVLARNQNTLAKVMPWYNQLRGYKTPLNITGGYLYRGNVFVLVEDFLGYVSAELVLVYSPSSIRLLTQVPQIHNPKNTLKRTNTTSR